MNTDAEIRQTFIDFQTGYTPCLLIIQLHFYFRVFVVFLNYIFQTPHIYNSQKYSKNGFETARDWQSVQGQAFKKRLREKGYGRFVDDD
jgi:hypothetical protein